MTKPKTAKPKTKKVGSKRQLENGTWELSVSMGSDLKGNRLREYDYVEAETDTEAEIALAEFITACKKGDYSDGDRMLLKDYAPMWEKDHVEEQLRKKTKSRYSDLIERVVEFLGKYELREVVKRPVLLKQFYKELQKDGVRKDKKPGGLSLKTIREHHAVLSSMFASAVEWKLVKENPCSRVKPPKEKRRDRRKKKKNYFTIDQAKLFLQALDKLPANQMKYKVAVFLAISTGFRRGEIMGLEWSDIDFKKNLVSVERTSLYTVEDGIFEDDTKTESSARAAYIPKTITSILKEYKAWWEAEREKAGDKWTETNRLFIQWDGKPAHPDTISQWFPEFIRNNNLPYLTYHGLRHTYGSILLAMGMDLESVAALLGHENIQMLVQTYGHNVKQKANQEAANLIDAALLQKDPPAVENKSPEAHQESKIPESLPEDIRLLIEKLIATYAPSGPK